LFVQTVFVARERHDKKRAKGLEPSTFSLEVHASSNQSNCNSNDLRQEAQDVVAPVVAEPKKTAPADPELSRFIDAWPTLPKAVRAGIVAMIDAATKGE